MHTIETNTKTAKTEAPKATKANKPTKATAAAKACKAQKEPTKAKAEKDEEPADRLPASVEELKESKSGLVTFLFLSGKDKAEIAKELAVAFKLGEEAAVKIVRRITGRARFFQRAFSLVPAK